MELGSGQSPQLWNAAFSADLRHKGMFGLTHDIDRVGWTRKALRIILDYVGGLVYSLHRASLDVELIVAETLAARKTNMSVAVKEVLTRLRSEL